MGTAGRDCEPSGLQRAVWRESDLFGRERRAQPQDTHAVKVFGTSLQLLPLFPAWATNVANQMPMIIARRSRNLVLLSPLKAQRVHKGGKGLSTLSSSGAAVNS